MQDLGKFYIKMGKFERVAQMLFCCAGSEEKDEGELFAIWELETYTLNFNADKCKERSGEKNTKK